MTNKTWPGTEEQEIFVIYSEHMPKIREDRKYFTVVLLLCHGNGCDVLGNPLTLCNKAIGARQTTVSRPQQEPLLLQVADVALTSLLFTMVQCRDTRTHCKQYHQHPG